MFSKGRKEILRIHKPGLRVKLNMLISVNEIFSFQISSKSHKQREVGDFLRSSLMAWREKNFQLGRPYVVMDNGPKNRSTRVERMSAKGLFVPPFITPCCPEENLIEQVFGIAEKRYYTRRALASINASDTPLTTAVLEIISALASITPFDLLRTFELYLSELQNSSSNKTL